MRNESFLKIHGNWKIKKIGNIILSVVEGSWNKEAALVYFDQHKKLEYSDQDYVEICNLVNWELSTPESMKIIVKIEKWHRKKGRKYLALVIGESAIIEFTSRNAMVKNDLPEGFEICYFENIDSGIKWLSSKGFTVPPEEIPYLEKL